MSDGPAKPSSYEPFRPLKRTPHKMQTPWCNTCQHDVDSWLFHRTGHIDGSPLLLVRCHGTMITEGCDLVTAPVFVEQFTTRFLSGNERLEITNNATNFTPNEGTYTRETPSEDHGGGRGSDPSDSESVRVRPAAAPPPKDLLQY